MIRAEVFWQALPAHPSMEHPAQRHSINHAAVDAKPIMRRVNWSITTSTQCVLKVADSHWNKSQQAHDDDDQMNEEDDDNAHPDMLSKPEKHLILAQFSNSPWTRSRIISRSSSANAAMTGISQTSFCVI
jgi:hypothetical protein